MYPRPPYYVAYLFGTVVCNYHLCCYWWECNIVIYVSMLDVFMQVKHNFVTVRFFDYVSAVNTCYLYFK